MKTGFSSLVCPNWDIKTIISNASAMGFDGVELRGLRGEFHLPLIPELVRYPEQVKDQFAAEKVELVCLGASVTLTARSAKELAKQCSALMEFIELADHLACPFVRIFVGEAERGEYARAALARVADALRKMAPQASSHNVTILVENSGDFVASEDMWFLIDSVGHPSVRACWNQCNAMVVGERATVSIPRLGGKIGLVHMCDADFDEHNVLSDYKPLGQGHAEAAREIELLRGLLYAGYLMFEWPKMWVKSLSEPDVVLPGAAEFLRARVDAKQNVLSAYKGDKKAPKWAPRPAVSDTP